MKLIDKTPFRSEETRTISPMDRIQATLKYGLSWYSEIEAQDKIVAVLGKNLDRNFTIMQNITLPGTEITVPLILVSTSGVFLLYVTTQRGLYRAKAEDWGTIDGDHFTPAKINLLTRTARLARVVQSYLEKQGFQGMIKVEPVLLASEPGMHIESVRPLVRIVMSDALERFAVSIQQAQAVFSPEAVSNIVMRLQTPKPTPKPGEAAAPDPAEEDAALYGPVALTGQGAEINADSFKFEEPAQPINTAAETPAGATSARRRRQSSAFQFSSKQWIVLGVFIAFQILILIAFILIMIFNA
jgi:hypothetical protein